MKKKKQLKALKSMKKWAIKHDHFELASKIREVERELGKIKNSLFNDLQMVIPDYLPKLMEKYGQDSFANMLFPETKTEETK